MWFLESLDGWACYVRIDKIACWSWWDGRPKCPFSNKYLTIVRVLSRDSQSCEIWTVIRVENIGQNINVIIFLACRFLNVPILLGLPVILYRLQRSYSC
jgi:hypothetical protein